MTSRLRIVGLIAVAVLVASCGPDVSSNWIDPVPLPPSAPRLANQSGAPLVSIVIPTEPSPGLETAGLDFSVAVQKITGADKAPDVVEGTASDASTTLVVEADVDTGATDTLGEQGYRIEPDTFDKKHVGLRITGATKTGAMYGIYKLIGDMGVRYFHPEQTFFPSDPNATLPWDYDGTPDKPNYKVRGFHEHTQHPIIASDFYLRPTGEFRDYASHYIRWLARNRQNFMSWEMLKTVDLDTWSPYISDIINEAHGYGIRVGIVVSFVDEQQNSFKIIRDDRFDADGQRLPDDQQIEQVLTRLADLGIDSFTFQIGSSEFTKPADDDVLAWLNKAADVLGKRDLSYYAWIHTTCALKADDGSLFYHLPLKADASMGAWVHTTMFWTLDSPAPVYGCQDFGHQVDFIDKAAGKRELIYFPETAWWLGFDNNVPLALPLTGWARAYDIQQALADYHIDGHVTFTSGREWDYWMYDHFLTQITWDNDFGWDDYLEWIKPVFGEHGDAIVAALEQWTDLQKKNFFEQNPLIYFYLAGELPQDEIGQNAGILARRPKLAFRKVAMYDQADFDKWKHDDFEMLQRMRDDYQQILDTLPESAPKDGDLSSVLYHEAYTTLRLYVMRIDHALALYSGVIEARKWVISTTKTDQEKQAARDAAEAKLDEARAITEQVKQIVAEMETHYRYPVDLLAREKPESPTSYPFGYLYHTHTALFWARRDDQLELLINQAFSDQDDDWTLQPDYLFVTDGDHAKLLVPDNPVAAHVIEGFTPPMLFGLQGDLSASGDAKLVVAHDYNQNLLPDTDTEIDLPIDKSSQPWTATTDQYTLHIRDSAGQTIGDGLLLYDPLFELTVGTDADNPDLPSLDQCDLTGQVNTEQLIGTVMNVSGIDHDGAESLLRSVFDVPDGDPTPERVEIKLRLTFEPAAN